MKKTNIKSKTGFTIIEVVLVLAVAGLIFLMVFVALPNLQITQRDTQRKDALDKVSSKLSNYIANNNRLPSGAFATAKRACFSDKATATWSSVTDCSNYASFSTGWDAFIVNYLLAYNEKDEKVVDPFIDPNGSPYALVVTNKTKVSDISDLKNFGGTLYGKNVGAVFVVAPGHECNDGSLDTEPFKVSSNGARSFAVAVRTEGSGVACVSQ